MNVLTTALNGVLLLELKTHGDERGVFAEVFVQERYADAGVALPFVQDNWSVSGKGVLRGLHFQAHFPQGKLVTVCHGRILDVVADVNPASPTFGQHVAVELSGLNEGGVVRQLWVPPGYAHGFLVLSEEASVLYKCTEVYRPEDEAGVIWSDVDLAIDWPVDSIVGPPVVSEKDRRLPSLQQWVKSNG